MEESSAARLYAVNVAASRADVASDARTGRRAGSTRTAIDKRPVSGRVGVGPMGVAGDRQGNRAIHGGRDMAVYAFAREDVVHWETELRRVITPGGFGENFSTVGVEVSEALIGERWRVGSGDDALILEVTMPRTPCMTFARWMGEPRSWIERFASYGRVGAYLRVIAAGEVQAGDAIEAVHRPDHGVTAGAVLRGLDAGQGRRLLDAHAAGALELCTQVLSRAREAVGRPAP